MLYGAPTVEVGPNGVQFDKGGEEGKRLPGDTP